MRYGLSPWPRGALDVAANVLYLLAVRRGLLSVVSVLTALYPVSTVVLARLVLRERFLQVQRIGMGLAVVAVVLLSHVVAARLPRWIRWLRSSITGCCSSRARGPIPNVAELVAGEPIRGSWWAHPISDEIFAAVNLLADSPDLVRTRLVNGKVTLVAPSVVAGPGPQRRPASPRRDSPPSTRSTRPRARTRSDEQAFPTGSGRRAGGGRSPALDEGARPATGVPPRFLTRREPDGPG